MRAKAIAQSPRDLVPPMQSMECGPIPVRLARQHKPSKRMYSSHDNLSGRKERRLPIIVVVRLTPLEHTAEGDERTYTDNLSAHGLRVHSRRTWNPGEQVEINSVTEDTPVRAEVVYCQQADNHGFFVGFKFPQSRLTWSIWRRFDGIY